MHYAVNMAVVNYFVTQIADIEKIDVHMQIELAELYEKDLNESEDHFIVSDLLLSENSVILIVKDSQVESYEDEEGFFEYTLANQIPFKDVVECVANDEEVHLTKEDLALSNTKIEKLVYSTKQMVSCSSHSELHWCFTFCS